MCVELSWVGGEGPAVGVRRGVPEAAGVSNNNQRAQTCTFEGPVLQTPRKFHEKTPQRGRKSAKFWAVQEKGGRSREGRAVQGKGGPSKGRAVPGRAVQTKP